MSECYIQCDDHLPVKCDDCDWTGTAGQTDMVSDIQERLTPGGVVPAGQCPECGALAYLIEDKGGAPTPADPGGDDGVGGTAREAILEMAREQHDSVEIGRNAEISMGDENGAYVSAWVWVDFSDTALDKRTAVVQEAA